METPPQKKNMNSDRITEGCEIKNPVYTKLPCVYSMQFNGWRLCFFIHNTLYVSISNLWTFTVGYIFFGLWAIKLNELLSSSVKLYDYIVNPKDCS